MIDEFVRRGGNTLFSRQSNDRTIPVFKLARLSVDDIPLQRGGPVRGQRVEERQRIGKDCPKMLAPAMKITSSPAAPVVHRRTRRPHLFQTL